MEFEYICMVQTHSDRDTHNITIATATDDPTYLYVYYDEDGINDDENIWYLWWILYFCRSQYPLLECLTNLLKNIRKGHVNTQLQWIWKGFCFLTYLWIYTQILAMNNFDIDDIWMEFYFFVWKEYMQYFNEFVPHITADTQIFK